MIKMPKETIKASFDNCTFLLRDVLMGQQSSEEMTAFIAVIQINDKFVGDERKSGKGESDITHILPDRQKAYAGYNYSAKRHTDKRGHIGIRSGCWRKLLTVSQGCLRVWEAFSLMYFFK